MEALPPTGGFDKQPLKAPHQSQTRGKDKMGRIHKEDHTLTGFGLFQAWFELLGFKGFLGCDLRFGGNLTNFAWFHPQGFYELTRLRRPALEPRQGSDPYGRLGHTGGGALPPLCLNTRAVGRQLPLSPMKGHLVEFGDAAFAVRMKVTVEGRFGNGTEATDGFRRQSLTLQVEGLHFALSPRVRMVKSPVVQRFPLSCGKLHLVHQRASW